MSGPEVVPLAALAQEHLAAARTAGSGRSAHTVVGGHDHVLRQTLLALAEGRSLAEHESPGEATVQVLVGRVTLTTETACCTVCVGELVVIPDSRHALEALEDSVVLLTVAQPH